MKILILVAAALTGFFCLGQDVLFGNYDNNTCGQNTGNTYAGFQRVISVSGLGSTLGPAQNLVLKQVNVQIGNSTCRGVLNRYFGRLVAPDGTWIQLFEPLSPSSTSAWANISFRDDPGLNVLSTYSTTVGSGYFPFSIGYYRPNGSFSAFDGLNPNGDWVFQMAETTSSEASFEKVELIFGPPHTIADLTSQTDYGSCSESHCMEPSTIIRATNNGFLSPDPNYPGNTVDGCSWNGANNNSAWFHFTASSSTAYLTVSGLRNTSSTGSSDQQLIVMRRPTGDCGSSGWEVPNGGCPNPSTTSGNNASVYHSSNGGGTSTLSNVYSNGITANAEFNLSGLTVGHEYILMIDGNGGAASDFYVEFESGAAPCTTLPVELENFKASCTNDSPFPFVNWQTSSEINNDYFSIFRSLDGINWELATIIDGQGTTTMPTNYEWLDREAELGKIVYYKLQQTDFDGTNYNLGKISANCKLDEIHIFPNPTSNNIFITGIEPNSKILILDMLGNTVKVLEHVSSGERIDLSELHKGKYFIQMIQDNSVAVKPIIKVD